MAKKSIREEGFSKDADKLVRRLSLVALLLSRGGHPVSAAEIRARVEGYPIMTDEAFKRRFYEDRTELAALGVEIQSTDGDDGELYSLPADAYYLPPVDLDGEELAALAACLAVLEGRFAYSQPLRLALLSLAQGRPGILTDAAAPALAVLPEGERGEHPAVLPKLQAAIAERKTVKFSYYAISQDQELEREVDPYGLQLVAGEWYLIGWCHLRQAIRTFRLSRIRSRVTHATRAPHDFAPPEGFDIAAYRDRPAWQLGDAAGMARIRIAPAMAWWVEAHFGHAGEVARQDDGGIVFTTPYAAARPLLGWVLGLADQAELLEPATLREELGRHVRRLQDLLDSPEPREPARADEAAGGAAARRRARRDPSDWQVEVDHFTRLTALTTQLLQRCDGDEAVVDVLELCATLGIRQEELRQDVRLLNLVNFGADGALLFAEYEGRTRLHVYCDLAGPAFVRPAHLSPLQADTLLLAVELVGGQLPSAHGAALASAAQKLRRARSAAPATLDLSEQLPPADEVLAAVNAAIKDHRLLEIEYWREGTTTVRTRLVEPYLLIRSRDEWYYVCWCRTAGGTRVFRVATTKRATLSDERFTPRPDVELDLYRREGIPTSERYAPKSATVWYSPVVRRWIEERQPVTPLPDGSCLAQQPYVDVSWLTHTLLRFAGQARPLRPPEAVADLRATLARLSALYPAP